MPATYQSIIINAPIARVWEKLSNFHDLSWAHEVISYCQGTGDKGASEVGAQRILNGVFYETLTHIDAQNYLLTYSIDDGPSPVSANEVKDYLGTIQLRPVTLGDITFVEWSSHWKSHDNEAVDFCHGIYVELLNALAKAYNQEKH